MKSSRTFRLLPYLIVVLIAIGFYGAYVDQIGPFAPNPWWVGSWKPTETGPTHRLDLQVRSHSPRGQLVVAFGTDGRFLQSSAVVGGEARGGVLLFACESEKAGGDQVLYALRYLRPGRATLYRLAAAPNAAVRLNRPDGPTGWRVLFPADLDRHTKVAELIAEGEHL